MQLSGMYFWMNWNRNECHNFVHNSLYIVWRTRHGRSTCCNWHDQLFALITIYTMILDNNFIGICLLHSKHPHSHCYRVVEANRICGTAPNSVETFTVFYPTARLLKVVKSQFDTFFRINRWFTFSFILSHRANLNVQFNRPMKGQQLM